MFTARGARPPVFAHEALLIGTEGKLSKRLASLGVAAFREQDIEPIALIALLARLGTSDPVEPVTEVEPLLLSFDFPRVGGAPARFDGAEPAALNQRIDPITHFATRKARLPENQWEEAGEGVRPN